MFEPITLARLNKLVNERGGKCLSTEYINKYSKLVWQCKNNHVFEYNLFNIWRGAWCLKCKKLKILDEINEFVKMYNGKCLSLTYKQKNSKLLWQCKNNHEFIQSWGNVLKGNWCKKCKKLEQFEEIKEIAKNHGGICLSEKFTSNTVALSFKCKDGHIFKQLSDNIKKGNWCKKCISNEKLKDVRDIAIKHGGLCLSEIYNENTSKLNFKCKYGHIFKMTEDNIKKGNWCLRCEKKENKIKYYQDLAQKYGGKCLSEEYLYRFYTLKWQCQNGHIWETLPYEIERGHWCRRCADDTN
ncbi:MAG: hypothetical protein A2033_05260 [Bacteroidetes bacterium GWA2_31_9]|nr:MAG: hypothetical protein A2033_05260 [Bacteroidetes bacterium GWA2_31_9]